MKNRNVPGGYKSLSLSTNPNYDFARGLLMKFTDFRDDGIKVRTSSTSIKMYMAGQQSEKFMDWHSKNCRRIISMVL
jgi:hypothetical protein